MKTVEEEDQFMEFVCSIYELWDEFGFSVTSWFRSVKRNASVGGEDTSKHLRGLAVDVVPDDIDDESKYQALKEKAMSKALIVVDERKTAKPHIHIQTKQ